jgi:transposase
MARYKALSEDLRRVLVHMHHKRNLTVQDIERHTGVKARTIQNILKLFHDTGKVFVPKKRVPRPCRLHEDNIDVSHGCNAAIHCVC